MNNADSNVTDMKILHIKEYFSSFSATFIEDRFSSFLHLIFKLLKNDLGSSDNSDSVSSFPMMYCCGFNSL